MPLQRERVNLTMYAAMVQSLLCWLVVLARVRKEHQEILTLWTLLVNCLAQKWYQTSEPMYLDSENGGVGLAWVSDEIMLHRYIVVLF